MKVTAIIVAAGESKRLPAKKRKPYINLGARPILIHTLSKFASFAFIKNINLVVNRKDLKIAAKLIQKTNIKKDIKIIKGGKIRSASVYQGLINTPRDCEYVVIHDAVRPFFKKELLKMLIKQAKKYGASILATPVKPTIKEVTKNHIIERTLVRKKLWEAQTPQAFKKDILIKAYKRAHCGKKKAPDDSSLVEKLGIKVKIVPSDDENIKITTPVDLSLAKTLIKKRK